MSIASWFAPSTHTISERALGRNRPAPRRAATRANSASLRGFDEHSAEDLAFAHRARQRAHTSGAPLGRDKVLELRGNAFSHCGEMILKTRNSPQARRT